VRYTRRIKIIKHTNARSPKWNKTFKGLSIVTSYPFVFMKRKIRQRTRRDIRLIQVRFNRAFFANRFGTSIMSGWRIDAPRYRMWRYQYETSGNFVRLHFLIVERTLLMWSSMIIVSLSRFHSLFLSLSLSLSFSLQMVRYDFGRQVDRRPCAEGNALTSPLIPIQKKRRRKRGMLGGWKGWKRARTVMHSPRAPGVHRVDLHFTLGGLPSSRSRQR